MEDGLLSLKWNNHKRTFTKAISLYREQALYTDVTLACNGQYFHVHKIILSSCSEYFQEIFTITQCKQPVIVLKDIRPVDVEHLLQYIYLGEVDVRQTELPELIKAAESLRIKGLATPDDDKEDEIPKKKKRKRPLLSDRPESPKKKTSSPSNINSNESLNLQTSQNTQHLNEPNELIKLEPDDVDIIEEKNTKLELDNVNIIEEINTKLEFDKLEEKTVVFDDSNSIPTYDNYEEKEMPYTENKSHENLNLANPRTPIEYLSEYDHVAGPSGISEDSTFDESLLDESNDNQESNLRISEASKYYIRREVGQWKLYYCTSCKYSTPYNSKLSEHSRKHTGEKPFKCQYCDFCATTKQSVKRHEKIHTGEKPYACSRCPYRAALKQYLRFHQITKH